MMFIPGAAAAVAATHGFAQTTGSSAVSQNPSSKRVLRYGRAKASYHIPRSEAKSAKYVGFLTAFLGLTPDQQQQAASIFTAAVQARQALRSNMKTARQNFVGAIRNKDRGAAGQLTGGLGILKHRR
jgi:hypothetical protein